MNGEGLVPLFAAAISTGFFFAGAALGQAYPAKPVRIVVGFSPGGTTDILAREIGARMQENWGRAMVVDNRPGAVGNIGADVVAKAPPDGYTLLLARTPLPSTRPYIRSCPTIRSTTSSRSCSSAR
jgi:tripartite-type tricarboxylate transporter receptor subunit TctC